MIDAPHVYATFAKLFPIERRMLSRESKCSLETRAPHCFERRRGYLPEQTKSPIGISAQGDLLREFDGLRKYQQLDPIWSAAANELLEEIDRKIDFFFGNIETRRQSKDVLIVAANIEHQAHPFAARVEITFHSLGKDFVRQLAIRFVTILA